jgi:hypothetical protein
MNGQRFIRYSMTAPEIFARFIHFRSSGAANPKIGNATLGVGVRSMAGLVNAVELRFDITRDNFEEYRIRRWIDDEEAWQRLDGRFIRFHRTSARDDTPEPFGPRQYSPPDIYDYDSPGIPLMELASRSLLISRGVRTNSRASELLWVANFKDWVEGRQGQNWSRISTYVSWTSVLSAIWQASNRQWAAGSQMRASTGRTQASVVGGEVRMSGSTW